MANPAKIISMNGLKIAVMNPEFPTKKAISIIKNAIKPGTKEERPVALGYYTFDFEGNITERIDSADIMREKCHAMVFRTQNNKKNFLTLEMLMYYGEKIQNAFGPCGQFGIVYKKKGPIEAVAMQEWMPLQNTPISELTPEQITALTGKKVTVYGDSE